MSGWQKAADYVEDLQRSGGALSNPQARRELGTVVLVKNNSGTYRDRFDVLERQAT